MKAPNTKERSNVDFDDKDLSECYNINLSYITMLVHVINALEAESDNNISIHSKMNEIKLLDIACWWWNCSENKDVALQDLNKAIADGGWEGWKFEFTKRGAYHCDGRIVKA